MNRLGRESSGVVGSHAVIAGSVAGDLARLLGDWERNFVRLGMLPPTLMPIAEAVQALRAAAAIEASRSGSAEGAGKSDEPSLVSWISTREVADRSGVTERRVRQRHEAGEIEGVKIRGRLLFPPETPARLQELRRAA